MKKPLIELLIVALMAIPLGAHGVSALVTHRLWMAPRLGKPYELAGGAADRGGLIYLGLAALLFAVWFAVRSSHRRLGLALVVLCAAGVAGGLIGALLAA